MSELSVKRNRLFPLWDALVATFRTIFRPTTTTPLPWKGERERSERYRATFALVHNELGEEACIGCKMCEKICPSQVITVVPAGRKESPVTGKKRGYCADFTLDLNACLVCELCVQVCPEDSILMLRAREPVGFSREALVLTMDKLYANEKLEKLAWHSGSVFGEMQDPKKGMPKPPPKAKKPPVKKPAPPKAEEPKAEA
ncbi:MAG: 4Fe-4S dicluster domain-containing protein, partial [Proteobacteria bacterium]|nr:4Fe-4S dicluster domain-containing protein [Pseudomonadota bacterium]